MSKKKTYNLTPDFDDLDDYERELEESIERGEWVSVDNMEENRKIAAEIAVNTLADIEKKESKRKITTSAENLQKYIFKKTKKKISYSTLLEELSREPQVVSDKMGKYLDKK